MTSKKDEFMEQMKKKLDELNYRWNIERNKFEAKAQIESSEVVKKFEGKREELRRLSKNMEAKIKDLESAGGSAWDDVKTGVEDAWTSLATAFEKATSHFKKEDE